VPIGAFGGQGQVEVDPFHGVRARAVLELDDQEVLFGEMGPGRGPGLFGQQQGRQRQDEAAE
jgi:hypothetical protein